MDFYLNDYFVANGVSLRDRVSELFDELERNTELAQVFIRNPILVLQEKVFPELGDLNEEILDAANQFLYSVLSNDQFMRWLEKYQVRLINQYNRTKKIPTRNKVLRDLARAFIETGDSKILADLLDVSFKASPKPLYLNSYFDSFFLLATKLAVFLTVFVKSHIAVSHEYFFSITIYGPPDKISLLKDQQIVTISPRELKSLSEKMVNHAKKMRARAEEKALDE